MSREAYLSRRILCAFPRFAEAATEADEKAAALYLQLTPGEVAVCRRLRANLAALREEGPAYDGERPREGAIDTLLDGLLLGAAEVELLLAALAPKTVGERMAWHEALTARTRKEKSMANEPEVVPYRPLAERVAAYVAEHGIDLGRTIPVDVQTRMARDLESTAGSVGQVVSRLRKERGVAVRAPRTPDVNGKGHEAPPPVARPAAPQVSGAARAEILAVARAIAEAVLWEGAASIPESLRPHLVRLTKAALTLPEEES